MCIYKRLMPRDRRVQVTAHSYNSKLYIDEGTTTILSEEIKHEHPPPNNLEQKIILNQVKRKAMDDLTEKPLKNTKARRKNTAILPNNLRETQETLLNIPTLTNKDEEFLLINDSENKITAFSTMTILKCLLSKRNIYGWE
ncbi:MULE domain-containing protein [Aphis craccivora]|uniref:MULE domain-containing protein n=1 Tax=Aphis craccivora TaxID=307492 RepID=A0A6G0W693_APHCR|nr:MULE domain-containing protein [Aphis craccivora]